MGAKCSSKWSGYQAQHDIPAEMGDNAVIQKIGMNLDDASNGILLRTPDERYKYYVKTSRILFRL